MEAKHANLIIKEQGDANNYVLMGAERTWLMAIQMNGEYSVEEQRHILNLISSYPCLLKALKEVTQR